jgi:hypothetical protein
MTRILYPVFVQVALTFALFFWMGVERMKAYRAGTVKRGADAGQKPVWPERAGVISNAFHNQLELPMLFHAAVAFAMLAGGVDSLMIVLAWAFALMRLVHAGIYTTYNNVPHRFMAYALGAAFVLAMWVKLFLHVSTGGATP